MIQMNEELIEELREKLKRKKEDLLLQSSKIENEEIKQNFEKEIEVIFEEKEEILNLTDYIDYILEKNISYNRSYYDVLDEKEYIENKIKEIFDFYETKWNIKLLLLKKKIEITEEKTFAKLKVIPHKKNSSLSLNLDWEENEEKDNYFDEEEIEEEKRKKDEKYIRSLAEQHKIMEIISLRQKIEEELKKRERLKVSVRFL